MKNKLLQESLKTALDMEKRGHKFYKQMSQKCINGITRKMFDFLAKSEMEHIESIERFYHTLKEKDEFPTLSLKENTRKRKEDLTIFAMKTKELKSKIKPSDSDKKACEFAMEFENSGYRYYENILKKTKNKNLIKLLKFLLKEESQHFSGIENLHTYLTDSRNWYMYSEGSFPQG